MQVGAVEVEIEVKYENPEAAAVAGRFRVLSTSRLTSRIRQENIHNEREYEFSFAPACWPLPPLPESFTEIAASIRGKTLARASSFSMLSHGQKFPLAYIFLIKVILAGLHTSMWNLLTNTQRARMFIRLHRISSSNFTRQDPCARPYPRVSSALLFFFFPLFFSQFPRFPEFNGASYPSQVPRPRFSPRRNKSTFRRSSSTCFYFFLPPLPFSFSPSPLLATKPLQKERERKRETKKRES